MSHHISLYFFQELLEDCNILQYLLLEDVVAFGNAPDFWGRGPGFESGISDKDPGALQDHCVIL